MDEIKHLKSQIRLFESIKEACKRPDRVDEILKNLKAELREKTLQEGQNVFH